MRIHRLSPPVGDEEVLELRAGDQVLLSGKIYSARDTAHRRLFDLIKQGKELPIQLKGQAIYYMGPSPARPGRPIGAAGPTTSYRMDPYTPLLLEQGLKLMIGKGKRSQAVRDAIVRYKGAYLAGIGGAGALMSKAILSSKVVAYEELGPEAIRELEVLDLPCIVINDPYGNDLYEEGQRSYSLLEG